MRKDSRLGIQLPESDNLESFDWFSCDKLEPPFHVQDTTHVGTEARNLILKTKRNPKKLPFGKKYFIDVEHLEYLRLHFSKSEHMLCATTLNPVDRQNFKSVELMCDKKVTDSLRKNVKNSEGTAKFLEIVRDVIAAFMDPGLTPLGRIEKIWSSLFIIRIWRQYILSMTKTTLKNNFLTYYTYICIELNAHSLVLIIDYLRENSKPELFKPDLYSSQPCESFFRAIRSFTSTFSTVANCSVKEILDRIKKLQLKSDISANNAENYVFPRETKASDSTNNKIELPTRREIYNEIEGCKKRALRYAKSIGLIPKKWDVTCQVLPYIPKTAKPKKDKIDIGNKCLYSIFKVPMLLKSGSYSNYADKFQDVCVDKSGPFVEMDASKMKNNKKCVVKKTFLCWLLRANCAKLSSDRLVRVRAKIKSKSRTKNHCEYGRQFKS